MTRKYLLLALKILIIAAIFGFLFYTLRYNAGELKKVEFHLSWPPFLLSCALVFLLYITQVLGFNFILAGVARRVPLLETGAVWFASQIAKYVPGKVMLPLVRFSMFKRRGISIKQVTTAIYLELVCMTGGITMIFLISSFAWIESINIPRWPYMLVVPIALLAIHPRLLEKAINFGLILIKQEPLEIKVTYLQMILLGAWYVFGWLIYAAACWLLMQALGDTPLALAPQAIGSFTLAWLVGFLTFLTPGGLGVREAFMIGLLSHWFPVSVSTAAAFLARLQWTGMELLGAALTIRYRPTIDPKDQA